jgi:excisionase family DNA binding protein
MAHDAAATGKPLLITVEETAILLTLSEAGVRKWIATGALKAVKLGRAVRLRLSDVESVAEKGLPSASSQLTSAS